MKKDVRKEAAVARPMTKKQLSRFEREQRQRQVIFGLTGFVAILIVAILGFGYWNEYIHVADEAVATVGTTDISTRSMAKLMSFYDSLTSRQIVDVQKIITDNQAASQTDDAKKQLVQAATVRLQQLQSNASQLDTQAVDQLVTAEVLRREAASRKLEITQADRDQALVAMMDLGVDSLVRQIAATPENPAVEPPKTAPTPDQVTAATDKLNAVLENGRILSQDDFKTMVLEPTIYATKIQDDLGSTIPTTAEQVHAAHILFDDEQKAKDTLALIKAGNLDFAAAAKQLSTDTGTKDNGGDLGWFPKGVMDPAFEAAAFALEPGQISDVVTSSFGYHIIKVIEKDPNRPVSADILAYEKSAAYSKWLGDQKSTDANKVTYNLSAAQTQWAQNNYTRPTLPQG